MGQNKIQIPDLNMGGTPSSSTYLRGDGTWATPSGSGGNYIPLTGTTSGNTVTGDIEFQPDNETYKIFKNNIDEGINMGVSFEDTFLAIFGSGSTSVSGFNIDTANIYMGVQRPNTGSTFDTNAVTSLSENEYRISIDDYIVSGFTSFKVTQTGVTIDAQYSNSRGLAGERYFGANYDDNTYVQKKYVDEFLKVIQVTGVTLVQSGWTLSGGFYEYNVSNGNITTTSIVNVIPNNSDYSTIQTAQVLPKTDSSSGSVKLYAVNNPTADIGVTLTIYL